MNLKIEDKEVNDDPPGFHLKISRFAIERDKP